MAVPQMQFDAPLGRMPTLQFVPPGELQVDQSYQRSATSGESQGLIKRIARSWDWSLCQPLVVSRRMADDVEELFVIDGQHRLEAAKLRGDIAQLPCVIAPYRGAADEAAHFVQINKQRRPLSKLEVFRAAIAAGEPDALALVAAIQAAGLSLATNTNYASMKPGQLGAVAGLEAAWKRYSPEANGAALSILAKAMPDQVLQYAGTIYPGIVAWTAQQIEKGHLAFKRPKMIALLAAKPQATWRSDIVREQMVNTLSLASASANVINSAWQHTSNVGEVAAQPSRVAPIAPPAPASPVASIPRKAAGFVPDGHEDGKAWCDQCEQRVSASKAKACGSAWCKLRDVA